MPDRDRRGPDATYRPNSAPFEGTSNYTTNYRGAVAPPRQSMKPLENSKTSDQPFDGTTGYRAEYIKHPIPPREMRAKVKYEPSKVPLDGLSHYKKDYPAKPFQVTQSCKPDVGAFQSDAPFHDNTTQKTDYKKWPVDRPYVRDPEQYTRPEGEMEKMTTHLRDFNKKPLTQRTLVKPADRKASPGKFNGVTNYNTDFRQWSAPERVFPKMQTGGYMPPEAPFEGQSHYTDDYHKHKIAPRQSFKPADTARQSDQPFDGITGYREEFIKHPLEARQKKEKATWIPNPSKMDDLSHYKKDYTEKYAAPVNSCKPEGGAYQSDAPFHGDTTQRIDFKKWPTERPMFKEPERYSVPEGNFDFNTTHNTNYTKKPIQPITKIRPPSRKRDPGRFEGSTNYNQDFRKWGLTERAQPKQQPDYIPNEAPFEGLSSYTDDYRKKAAAARASMRPTEAARHGSGKMEDDTMYRLAYTPKEIGPCPAALIEVGKTGKFVFTGEQDLAGHKFYQQVGTPPIAQANAAPPVQVAM